MQSKQSFFKIGSFIGFKSPDYLDGLIYQTNYLQANAMMFFAGSPQVMRVTDWRKLDRTTFWNNLTKNNINIENICIHAHYLINLANLSNLKVYQKSFDLLSKVCEFAQALKIRYIILHPGSALKHDRNLAMQQVANSLQKIIDLYPNIIICLETMSGKGSELGKNFDELKFLIQTIKRPKNIQVCWDTCHLFSAGYDIKNNLNQIITEFDTKIGLSKLRFIHLNDSKTAFNSRLDRHEKLGVGSLGEFTFKQLINHQQLKNKVWILETPHKQNFNGYKSEIAFLKQSYET